MGAAVGVDYIESIRDFLGDEEGRVFAQRARQYGLAEDGPELLPLMVLLRVCERTDEVGRAVQAKLDAFTTGTGTLLEKLSTLKNDLVSSVGGEIEDRVVQSIDDLQREITAMARALAQSEFTAAATVRTRAITEEVEALRRAAMESGPREGAAASAVDDVGESGFVFSMRELVMLAGGCGFGGALVMVVAAALHVFR